MGGFSTNRSFMAYFAVIRLIRAAVRTRSGSNCRWTRPPLREMKVTSGSSIAWPSSSRSMMRRRSRVTRGAQVVQRAVGQDPPVSDHHHPVAQGLDVVHIMGGQHDGDAPFPVQPLDEISHGELGNGVQADGGLVQEEHRRRVQQGRRQVAPHALAEAELTHRDIVQRFQVHERGEFVPGPVVSIAPDPVDVPQQIEGLDNGQVPPQLGPLAEHHADVGRVGDPVPPRDAAVDLAPARIRHQDAREDLYGRGLARPVGTDIAHQFSRFQFERDAVQGLDRPVLTAQYPV